MATTRLLAGPSVPEPVTSRGGQLGGSGNPTLACDVVGAAGLRVVAASVVGRDHVADGRTREDAYAWRLGPGRRHDVARRDKPDPDGPDMVVAVTDGVSNRPRGQSYALALAHEIVSAVVEQPWAADLELVLPDVAAAAAPRERRLLDALDWRTLSSHEADRPGDPAATVVVAALAVSSTHLQVRWCQVGDAAVGVLDDQGLTWLSQTAPRQSGRTYAMPRDVGTARCGTHTLDDGQTLVLASDGGQIVCRQATRQLLKVLDDDRSRIQTGDDLEPDPRTAADLASLLATMVWGEHDDRTVVLVRRHRTST